jgi:hypothetical protein
MAMFVLFDLMEDADKIIIPELGGPVTTSAIESGFSVVPTVGAGKKEWCGAVQNIFNIDCGSLKSNAPFIFRVLDKPWQGLLFEYAVHDGQIPLEFDERMHKKWREDALRRTMDAEHRTGEHKEEFTKAWKKIKQEKMDGGTKRKRESAKHRTKTKKQAKTTAAATAAGVAYGERHAIGMPEQEDTGVL